MTCHRTFFLPVSYFMEDVGAVNKFDEFESLRPYLFSLAYRMLGSASDAEDCVQEAFLRWQKTRAEVDSPKAFLSKVTTRLCLDHLRSARIRRETYVGPWLPEPIATEEVEPSAVAEQADSLSLAFLVVLESLSPVERAVFLLREVFDYDYGEIAEIVGVTEVNCRQVAHRAKQHIASRRPRHEVSAQKTEEMTYRFMVACAGGEMEGLVDILTDDIVLYSDSGGKAKAARRPIVGRDKVARWLVGVLKKAPPGVVTTIIEVNGHPAIGQLVGSDLTAVLSLDVAENGIRAIHIVVNPEKLQRVRIPS